MDEDDVTRPRVTRSAGVIGVLAVLAAFLGGFVAGRVTHDDDAAAIQAVGGDDTADTAGTDGTDDGATETTWAMGPASGPAMAPALPSLPQRLFRRTSTDGFSVRVFRNDMQAGEQQCAAGMWCPPPECNPSSYIEAQVVGEWSVAQGGGPLWPVRDGTPARVIGTVSTWYTDEPVFGVLVRTAAAVTNVRITYEGHSDEMAPIDGLAVIVVPDPNPPDVTMGRPFPEGAVVEAVVDGAAVPLPLQDAFSTDPACVPPPPAPPPLPDPGEQPSDVAAADAAVRAVFQQAFGAEDDAGKDAAIDDPAGLAEIREDLKARYPELLGDRITYEITEIVFTGPDTAAYYFRPVIADYSELPRQIGSARIVDGSWKVTRATACAMFSLGGAGC
jgi:hypothetical protein